MRGTLAAEAAGEFFAVERVQPVGVFGDKSAFVGLDVADDVPDDVGAVGKLGGFVAPFLDVVFAEVVLPVLVECADGVGGEGFADGDKLHAASRAAGLGFGLGDLGLDGLEVGDKVGHGGLGWEVVGEGRQPERGTTSCYPMSAGMGVR